MIEATATCPWYLLVLDLRRQVSHTPHICIYDHRVRGGSLFSSVDGAILSDTGMHALSSK